MVKSTPALVETSVLEWARVSAGYTVDEAARKLKIKPKSIERWESGEKRPSIGQVRNMATAYKRPFHFFFLERPPADPPIPHDFRRLPAEGMARYEPALRFQVRDVYERRQLALDLSAELDETPARFILKTSLQADAEAVGQKIRDFLGIQTADQKRARQSGANYRLWRSRIEGKDILVFQIANLTTKQMLGMSLSFDEMPVIAVNRKLNYNSRVFTLLHEFAHLMLGESGICDLSEDHLESPQAQQTEIFANKVAAATLLPKPDFLAEPIVSARGQGQYEWSNDELQALAGVYGTSEETVLRRFLTLGLTSAAFYQRKRAEYLARYAKLEQQQREEAANDDFKRNLPQEVLSDYGRHFTRLVLMNYAQDRISLTDASSFLHVKAPMVEKVERMLAERS
jgi:Zn-dependent peptidase ImmA (M78 family)/DNA-binding XRE family transcriptional regulator